MHTNIYIMICIKKYMNIYIFRERERENYMYILCTTWKVEPDKKYHCHPAQAFSVTVGSRSILTERHHSIS